MTEALKLAQSLDKYGASFPDGKGMFGEAAKMLRHFTALAQQEAQAEPVAWQYAWVDRPGIWFEVSSEDNLDGLRASPMVQLRPLYTNPAPVAEAKVMASPVPVAWTSLTSDGAVNFGKDWVFSPIKTGPAVVPLYTHTAPAVEAKVQEDVQRDADRYRCLRAIRTWPSTDFEFQAGLCVDLWGEDGCGQQVAGEELDHAVDTMLATSKEPTREHNDY